MDSFRRTMLSLGSCLALLAAPAAMAAPASAAASPPVVYDALGDSYASGFGVLPMMGLCGQSDAAYAVQIDGRMKIALDDFNACAGATVQKMIDEQLSGLDEETKLVTVTIGGNDIGWVPTIGACLLSTDVNCAAAINASTGAISYVLPTLLNQAYASIEAKAPNAHVIVTGYAPFFSPESGDYLNASVQEQQAMNDGANLLNATIAGVAAEHGFQFVDVTKRFAGHGVNSRRPYIQDLNGVGPFHPTAAGYRAYAVSLISSINPRSWR
ncbi:MAG: SGNH/GDSL hydrolase family protein [Ornithinimicrobium sp.]|uniref:SGNH/GDSL hydrolase family protein n=1 Tax=Ornithinimicrobium sp. TaxID=1977084 RepID=UPI0026E0D6DA|nr:SGNH/GDSL hydrolase family protein [Ornithinimicrobium sp.]MDO5740089.1 SGNH/GDSL hydrolase family protein [Ornithinimicrobium sp.]